MVDKRKYLDRRDELIKAVTKRRHKIKMQAIEYKGGHCQICGYGKFPRALDLHHLRDKKFTIGDTGYTNSWIKIQAELDKCILLCANCHREVEGGFTKVPDKLTK